MNDFLKTNKARPVELERQIVLEAPSDITFSTEQQQLIDLLEQQIAFLKHQTTVAPHKLTIVQGKAGSGKSTIIKEIVRRVRFTKHFFLFIKF